MSHETTPPEVPDLDLIRRIGEGGFGQVWLAANRTTGRLLAVKLIPLRGNGPSDPAGREIVSLTHLEAHVGNRHPNLLAIQHVGRTAEHLFYIMDPADDDNGGPARRDADYRPASLTNRLKRGALPPQDGLRYARQLLDALAHLHGAGMVHRDVKPANCLFVSGELKLADFGLLTEADPQTSRVGTLKYMPPDGRMDARADVYAAGLVIYEMIIGLPAECFPHLGDKALEVAEDPILGTLNRLMLRACQPDPQRRFRDAGEMLAALIVPVPSTAPRRGRKRRWLVVAAACLTLLAVAALPWWPGRQQPATAPQRVHVNFITLPHFDATIYLDEKRLSDANGTAYKTPCTVPDLPVGTYRVTFRHDDQADELDAGLTDLAKTREIVAHWDQPVQPE